MFASYGVIRNIIFIVTLGAIIAAFVINKKNTKRQAISFVSKASFLIPFLFVVISLILWNIERNKNYDDGDYVVEESDTEVEESENADLAIIKCDYDAYGDLSPLDGVLCEASSSLDSSKYGGDKLVDLDDSTCWQDGIPDDVGLGETLTFTFAEPTKLTYIAILNGRNMSEEKYYQNARPSSITVYTGAGQSATIQLEDIYNEYQCFQVDSYSETDTLTFQIDSVYEGSTYTDDVISEIRFYTE